MKLRIEAATRLPVGALGAPATPSPYTAALIVGSVSSSRREGEGFSPLQAAGEEFDSEELDMVTRELSFKKHRHHRHAHKYFSEKVNIYIAFCPKLQIFPGI